MPPHDVAEAVLADHAARMNNDAVADQSMGDHRAGADRTLAADAHLGADRRAGADKRTGADFGAWADDRARIDDDAVFQARLRMHMRAGHAGAFV